MIILWYKKLLYIILYKAQYLFWWVWTATIFKKKINNILIYCINSDMQQINFT